MKLTYQRKLTLSFLAIFVIFAAGVVVFENRQERRYKTDALRQKLDAYASVVNSYMEDGATTDSLAWLLPPNLRLTLISEKGDIKYDNMIGQEVQFDNHALRPEVITAGTKGYGYDIRTSGTNGIQYLYYAKQYGKDYVRVALPYDTEVKHFLKPDNLFLYFIIILLGAGVLLISYIGGRFGNSVRRLRDFSSSLAGDDDDTVLQRFPNDELGDIGRRIASNYKQLKDSEINLTHEREKLLQHVQSSAEGVCFFNPDRHVVFYNGLFLQYMNTISDAVISGNPDILLLDVFVPVKSFLKSRTDEKYFDRKVSSHGREFMLRVNVFDDESFEVVFNDITRQEQTRRLKQEMTGNIAHELRTPVTSIRGYLETVLNNELPAEKQRDFLQKAYDQTLSLSELIRDMGLLTKIEENPNSFDFGRIEISDVVSKVGVDLEEILTTKHISIISSLESGITVRGNANLLYSVFRNLADNVINHAGENTVINIRKVDEKDGYVYLLFSDNGPGIRDHAHINRLFERFYRVDEGRTRDSGGSGLGLSIVRNIISLHGGNITAKNGSEGGLEFLFSLPLYDKARQ